MKITEITTKILASLMAAAMITGGTAISMSAEEKNEKGTYANSKYELSGLKNPDGSLVQGINSHSSVELRLVHGRGRAFKISAGGGQERA